MSAAPLIPNQEIGSLAKPVWRIQALRGQPVPPEALAEARALAAEGGIPPARWRDLRDRLGDTRNTRVVCRTCDPSDLNDLALVRAAHARSIIVLCPEESGGDAEVVDRLRPVFAAFSTDVVHAGAVGAAQVTKAANNLVMWACVVANHEALALSKRFGVDVDPYAEVLPLIGSKEGIAHLAFCYLEHGAVAVVPDPGYPPYLGGTLLAGAEPFAVALKPEHEFLVPLRELPAAVAACKAAIERSRPTNSGTTW